MKNQMLAIFNSDGHIFSHKKVYTPKMVNALKAACEEYNRIFAPLTFKVHRILVTSSGYKKL